MSLRRTKRNENNATIFHSLSVFLPIRVSIISGYFRRSSPWAYGAPRGMKITPPFFISYPCSFPSVFFNQ